MGKPVSSKTERFLGLIRGDVVSFVGGGGKSMLMHSLARRLAREDRKVLVTATRIFQLAPGDSPYLFLTDERAFGLLLPNLQEHGAVTVAPERLTDGSLRGYRPDEVDTFADVGDYLFVEAETSLGQSLPLPPPAPRPVPPLTSVLVAVAGLDALGADLDCRAFAERLCVEGGVLTVRTDLERRILCLNKADLRSVKQDGARVAGHVREILGPDAVPKIVLTSVKDVLKSL